MKWPIVVAFAVALLTPGIARGGGDAADGDFLCDDAASRPYCVALPPGYADSGRRYPVVYLLEAASNSATSPCKSEGCARLTPFVRLARAREIILVLPFSGGNASYVDWRTDVDGTRRNETVFFETLIPAIDATFRTIADRAYRAVAGVSAGGYGAMLFASRHPDLFSTAASFSGPLDLTNPGVMTVETISGVQTRNFYAVWGDPVSDEVWWRNASPLELAPSLRGLSLFHSSGTGVACGPEEASTSPVLVGIEQVIHETNEAFDRRLTELGIAHTYRGRCGTHNGWTLGHWARDFEAWLETSLAFGARQPASFDYRRVDPGFSVFGWSFAADPRRAPEFLDLRSVSRAGLTVTGSGLTHMRTPRLFRPNQPVCVRQGATWSATRADRTGRLALAVDLGEPHQLQQYTPAQRVLEAAGGYFRTVTVTFNVMRC